MKKFIFFLLLLALFSFSLNFAGSFVFDDIGNISSDDQTQDNLDGNTYYTVKLGGDLSTDLLISSVKLNGEEVGYKPSYSMCSEDILLITLNNCDYSRFVCYGDGYVLYGNYLGTFRVVEVSADCVVDLQLYSDGASDSSGESGSDNTEGNEGSEGTGSGDNSEGAGGAEGTGSGDNTGNTGNSGSVEECSHEYEFYDYSSALEEETYYKCSKCNNIYFITCEHEYEEGSTGAEGTKYTCSKCGKYYYSYE